MSGYSDLYGSYSLTSDTLQVQNGTIINATIDTLNALNGINITSNANIVIPSPNKFIGQLSGNVTGSVIGDVTGNLTGNGVGNWVGNVQGNVTGTSTGFTGSLSGDITGPMNNTQLSANSIVNADINTAAGIVDTKLATITTTGKVANSATTGNSTNAANTLVLRNGNGDFTAGTITANLNGNATTATTASDFNGTLGGDITGTLSNMQIVNGAIVNTDINANAGIADTKLATISSSGKVANSATTATRQNVNGTIVLRDTSNKTILPEIIVEGIANAYSLNFTNSAYSPRWRFEIGGGEGADNIGSSLKLVSYTNSGDVFTNPINFLRNPREIQIGSSMFINYDKRYISIATGNDRSYLYCAFTALGDGYHLGHNLYYDYDSVTPRYATNAPTSRVSAMRGYVSLGAGANQSPATEYLRVDNSANIQAMNGAVFRGPIVATNYNSTGGFTIKTLGEFRGAMKLSGTNPIDNVTFTMGRGAANDFEMGVVGTAGSIINGTIVGESAFYNESSFAFGGGSVRLRLNGNGAISDIGISRQYELHVNPIPGLGDVANRRWLVTFDVPDSDNNGGSNWSLYRYSNTGAYLGQAMSIRRSDGLVSVLGTLVTNKMDVSGGIQSNFGTSNGNGNMHIRFNRSDGLPRFAFGLYTNESGSNSGSNFILNRYDDNGVQLGSVFYVNRSNGGCVINNLSAPIANISTLTTSINLISNGEAKFANASFRSGSAATTSWIEIGRVFNEMTLSSAAVNGDWFSSGYTTSSGDAIISIPDTNKKLIIGRAGVGGFRFEGGSLSALTSIYSPTITGTTLNSTNIVSTSSLKSNGSVVRGGAANGGMNTYTLLPGTKTSLSSSFAQRGTGSFVDRVFQLTSVGSANGCAINGFISITNNPATTTGVTNNVVSFTMSYAQGNATISTSLLSSAGGVGSITISPSLAWDVPANSLNLTLTPSSAPVAGMNYMWDAHFDIMVNQNLLAYQGNGTSTSFTCTVGNLSY